MESKLKTLEPGLSFRWESEPPPNALAWEQAVRSHFRSESGIGQATDDLALPGKGAWIRAAAVNADGDQKWRLTVSAGDLSSRIERALTKYLEQKGLPVTR